MKTNKFINAIRNHTNTAHDTARRFKNGEIEKKQKENLDKANSTLLQLERQFELLHKEDERMSRENLYTRLELDIILREMLPEGPNKDQHIQDIKMAIFNEYNATENTTDYARLHENTRNQIYMALNLSAHPPGKPAPGSQPGGGIRVKKSKRKKSKRKKSKRKKHKKRNTKRTKRKSTKRKSKRKSTKR